MEEQFVPYELAVKLKELGCKFYPFAYFSLLNNNKLLESKFYASDDYLECPLYQQAFDWFRERYNLDGYVFSNSSNRYTLVVKELFTRNTLIETPFNYKDTYEEAREACLERLIELCKKI